MSIDSLFQLLKLLIADVRNVLRPLCKHTPAGAFCKNGPENGTRQTRSFYRAMHCTVVQSAVLLSHVVCSSDGLSVCLWRWWIMTT